MIPPSTLNVSKLVIYVLQMATNLHLIYTHLYNISHYTYHLVQKLSKENRDTN